MKCKEWNQQVVYDFMLVNIHLFVPRNKDVVGREAMFSLEHLFSETLKKLKSTKAVPP
jgi:S-ribosylhomocysteine lyase LuxS involved in autoinducer biosynthesis